VFTISGGAANVTYSFDVETGDKVVVNSDATVTIAAGKTLTVAGDVVNAGTINGTGTVDVITGGSYTGNNPT
jgi:hypothetical protein